MRFVDRFLMTYVWSFIVILVASTTFYYGNINEFRVETIDVWIYAISFTFILGGLTFILSYLPFQIGQSITYISIIIGLSAWIQSQVLIWNFGPLDGRGIEWGKWNSIAYVELIFYVLGFVLLIIIIYKKSIVRRNLTIAIYILGFFSIMSAWMSSDDKLRFQHKSKEVSLLDYVIFSEKENNIVIVLDTFQGNVLIEILKNHPNEIEFLNEFTLYPNAVGGYPTTVPSIPTILSGEMYENQLPIKEWTLQSNRNSTFQELWKENSAFVSYYSPTLSGISEKNIIDVRDFKRNSFSKKFDHYLSVLDGGVFRAIPTILKADYYRDGNWYLRRNLEPIQPSVDQGFFNFFSDEAFVGEDISKTFKFYHLAGSHWPLQIDENYKFVSRTDNDWYAYIRQSRGVLTQLKRMFEKLKQIKAYDNSNILVIADHGTGFMGLDFYGEYNPWSSGYNEKAFASARPLFMFKPVMKKNTDNFSNSIAISNEAKHLKYSLCEFLNAEICDHMGGIRMFHWYELGDHFGHNYFPPIIKYSIGDDVRDLSSWQINDSMLYTSEGIVPVLENSVSLPFKQKINILDKNMINSILWNGWGRVDDQHVWSNGNVARMIINLNNYDFKNSLKFDFKAGPILREGLNKQTVRLIVNDSYVSSFDISESDWFSSTIPSHLIDVDGRLRIQFEIDTPVRPCDISNSPDCRLLGISLFEMQLR